jgi:hypothetical protein
MFHRLAACGFALIIVLAILFLVALRSDGADFDGDWLLEDLTCEELLSAYQYSVEEVASIQSYYEGCSDFYKGVEEHPHGLIHCALIKKNGMFVVGVVNDIVAVYEAKCPE